MARGHGARGFFRRAMAHDRAMAARGRMDRSRRADPPGHGRSRRPQAPPGDPAVGLRLGSLRGCSILAPSPLEESALKPSVTKRLAMAAFAAAAASAFALDYPATEKKPVSDTFFGQAVTEDYRWLENGKDPAVKAWGEAQMKLTRSQLDALPIRPALQKRLKELYSTSPVRYFDMQQRGSFFAMKRQPPKNQPFLVVMKSAGDRKSERVLLDPNTLDKGGTTAIDWYVPSLDGKYLAVSLSKKI